MRTLLGVMLTRFWVEDGNIKEFRTVKELKKGWEYVEAGDF